MVPDLISMYYPFAYPINPGRHKIRDQLKLNPLRDTLSGME